MICYKCCTSVLYLYIISILDLNCICAMAMTRNSASSRVMQKLGMLKEGTLIQYICKDGIYEELEQRSMNTSAYRIHEFMQKIGREW